MKQIMQLLDQDKFPGIMLTNEEPLIETNLFGSRSVKIEPFNYTKELGDHSISHLDGTFIFASQPYHSIMCYLKIKLLENLVMICIVFTLLFGTMFACFKMIWKWRYKWFVKSFYDDIMQDLSLLDRNKIDGLSQNDI